MPAIGNTLVPDFIEEDVIAAVERVLGSSLYPKYKVEISRISQNKENELGYDGVLTALVPFYLQFKRSSFATPSFSGKLTADRQKLQLKTDRGYFFFELLLGKHSAKFDQHNALHRLSKKARAAYVAPLFYKRENLSTYKSSRFVSPWYYNDIVVFDAVARGRPFHFQNQQFFKGFATIPPHKTIRDKAQTHSYSFLRTGEVCFHSEPEQADFRFQILSDFLGEILSQEVTPIDLQLFSVDLINQLPEILELGWRSKTLRAIVLSSLPGLLTEDLAGRYSTQALLLSLSPYNRLLLMENLLAGQFHILQYFKKEREF